MSALIEKIKEVLVNSHSLTGGVVVIDYQKPSEAEVIKKTLLPVFVNQNYPENVTEVVNIIEMVNTPSRVKYFREKGIEDKRIYFILLLTHASKRQPSLCVKQADIYLKGNIVHEKLNFTFIKVKANTSDTKRLINAPVNIPAIF